MGTKTQKLSNVVDQIVEWQSVFTGDGSTGLTAVAGRGYFIDTTSGTVTVTLPASPKAGDIVQLKDYARTWGTNAVSIASTTFDGASNNPSFSTNGQTVTLVYMDGTKGWSLINEDTTTGLGATFVTATGGTITTSGDYKIHTFTGDGCFVVSSSGNPAGSDSVDYLVVAGGGGGGGCGDTGGGGGAGGYRESHSVPVSGCYTASPLATPTSIPVSATTYPVTVGGGGGSGVPGVRGVSGSNSVFSTITSAGGGGGGRASSSPDGPGGSGGSGGGGGSLPCSPASGGSGNTPPTSPPQGNNGGTGRGNNSPLNGIRIAGGGGGATAAGGCAPINGSGSGGAGATTSISGSPTGYSGGGGGGAHASPIDTTPNPNGGPGGGGTGGNTGVAAAAGTANRGGGGGGATSKTTPTCHSAAGGKGIVIIRYKFQ